MPLKVTLVAERKSVPVRTTVVFCTPLEGMKLAIVGAAVVAVTVKLVLLISKKMFPTDSTLMRPVVVALAPLLGIFTIAEPLFGTLEASTTGNVVPPSVE